MWYAVKPPYKKLRIKILYSNIFNYTKFSFAFPEDSKFATVHWYILLKSLLVCGGNIEYYNNTFKLISCTYTLLMQRSIEKYI